MAARGKLIVIEGSDASGKATQTKLLVERLRAGGKPVETISFPRYGQISAALLEGYLKCGRYGPVDSVNPFAASLLFAVDRFDAAAQIRKWMEEGKIVVSDRYVESNAGHQGGKIPDPEKRKAFLLWLLDLEYEKVGIPKPDLVLILYVPYTLSVRLAHHRGERDGHEMSVGHLKNANETYRWLARNYPGNIRLIDCARGDEMYSSEAIHKKIMDEARHCIYAQNT